jgi:ribosomal protein S18 acetylase RimI-like enzyme
MSVEIRVFGIEFYEQAEELWKNTEGMCLRAEDDSKEAIARYLQRNPGMSFAAFEGGKMVGAVLCGHDGRRGYLNHLAVAGEFRGKGIAKELVQRAIGELNKDGINRCHIFVLGCNEAGSRFWEHMGWQERVEIKFMSRKLEI